MLRMNLLFATYTAIPLLLLLQTCTGDDNLCTPSSCGNIHNISYPFRLETDPKNCGNHRYTLSCENNTAILYLYAGKYYVRAINYSNFTIRLVDPGVVKDDCSSTPLFPLTEYNFSLEDPFTLFKPKWNGSEYTPKVSQLMIFMKCPFPVVNSSLYIDTAPCINDDQEYYSYVNIGGMDSTDFMSMCSLEMMVMLHDKDYKDMSFVEIHREMAYGFEVSWHNIYCGKCRGCYSDETDNIRCISGYFRRVCYLNFGIQCIYLYASVPTVFVLLVIFHCVTKTLCGTPFVFAFLIYKWRKRHLSGYTTIEDFLQSHNNLMPGRYSYSDIRKMTGGFKEKLGEGGFGSVYKGKLRSGHVAAIKMLNKSTTNGQDFINEVATIGRIYHNNIVQLIGFCVDGSRRALIYDFMSNGSLDNYLRPSEGFISLSWEKLFEISLGVARGIKYLHQDCDMQILHFDIKPHNVLLDENFVPKISDFGLAKLCATKDSIKSLTAARGTIGYMAPELFYRNIGNVSCKADVYSFGMLLLEMAGKRKKLNALIENSSESYFPFWVYDEVSSGKVVAGGDGMEESDKIAEKMVVVGLWCIQMKPSNRPPMNEVIEMLEGDLESLQLPPRPFIYPEEVINDGEESSSMLIDSSESSSLIQNSC
ncbi:kinase, putative [Ricinus communis]|uniref:Kinase, putative n=1 Tax=Ricinus communis TaxID=3988 RepID=B9SUU5_RICCO|nr:kinase, putative [Ricinus communis]